VYRQFPLNSIHPNAQKAAEASLCANDQGRFREMHDLMFEDQRGLSVEALTKKAESLELDGSTFEHCLTSNKYAEQVKQDVMDGTEGSREHPQSSSTAGHWLETFPMTSSRRSLTKS